MALYVCLFLLALQSVHGGVRRQIVIDPIRPTSAPYYANKQCDTICDEETHELSICGSNGVEYKTRCEFTKATCAATKAGDTLLMANYGPCVTLNSTCTDVLQARCVGTNYYTHGDESALICASNKQTYSGMCSFRHDECKMQQMASATQITIDHMGACVMELNNNMAVNCSQYFDDANQNIAIESGTIVPHATCTRVYDPVCINVHTTHSTVNFGRTFSNECQLCQYFMSTHQLTMSNMIGHALHTGSCSHNGLIG